MPCGFHSFLSFNLKLVILPLCSISYKLHETISPIFNSLLFLSFIVSGRGGDDNVAVPVAHDDDAGGGGGGGNDDAGGNDVVVGGGNDAVVGDDGGNDYADDGDGDGDGDSLSSPNDRL